ncbi:peptidyl-tRNA hydrolase II domain-containing protein [Dichotomocladium elegans]|nr:peptidyl-tRNA hydrolase II domain-containing protein [Dichotomocladium elegans]
METLTMFIVVRKDLAKTLGWNTGSVMAQACHAATAVLHMTRDHPNTVAYLEDTKNMHKVVLETKNAGSLEKLETALQEHHIPVYKWIEQPENIPTALATMPIGERSQEVKDAFKKLCSLYR